MRLLLSPCGRSCDSELMDKGQGSKVDKQVDGLTCMILVMRWFMI